MSYCIPETNIDLQKQPLIMTVHSAKKFSEETCLLCHIQEPWILHKFSEDFYGEELRLIVVGYIRPEVNLPHMVSQHVCPFPSSYAKIANCLQISRAVTDECYLPSGKFYNLGGIGGDDTWRWADCRGSSWYEAILRLCWRWLFDHSFAQFKLKVVELRSKYWNVLYLAKFEVSAQLEIEAAHFW